MTDHDYNPFAREAETCGDFPPGMHPNLRGTVGAWYHACHKPRGHDGPHHDGKGTTWGFTVAEPTRDDGQPAPVRLDADERRAVLEAHRPLLLAAVERVVTARVAAAVDRARKEGRTEVKVAVEEWFTNVSLDDLYAVNGWERPSSSASARGGDDGA